MYNKYHHVSLWIGGRIQILQLINNASGNYSIPFHYDYVTLHKKQTAYSDWYFTWISILYTGGRFSNIVTG